MNASFAATSAAMLLLGAGPAMAADPDIAAMRTEIAQMKQAYEARITALESKLVQYETKTGHSEAKAVAAETKAIVAEATARKAAVAASQKPSSEAAFNPAISAVLVGTYGLSEQNPAHYALQGFVPTGGEVNPIARNFSLGESELGIAANIDPLFRGQLTIALPPESGEVGVEEGFIQTLGLGHGTTLKAGRFLSAVGYLNQQHAHSWDFADAPLAYKAMLGGQLRNDGVQLKWVAPTDWLLELGAELANGGRFPSTDRGENGATTYVLSAHSGGDAGNSASWRAGAAWLNTAPRDRRYKDVDSLGNGVVNAFSGQSDTLVVDGIWKWAPLGNATQRNLTLQAEYFYRDESGQLHFDADHTALAGRYTARQSGLYAQAVYQFMPRWRVGYRFDWLDAGTRSVGLVDDGSLLAADFPLLAPYDPQRHAVMLDWTPSEFSRLRLQYAHEDSRPGANDNQLLLQIITSLGAHGAHRF